MLNDDSLYDLFNYLLKNNTGTDLNIEFIRGAIEYRIIDTDYEIFVPILEKIFTKNLKLGITAKSFNKIFKEDKIPVFSAQLGEKYEPSRLYDDEDNIIDFTITPKIDGNRCLAIIKPVNDTHDITFYSREGIETTGLIELDTNIKAMCKRLNIDQEIVIDGELLAHNLDNLSSKDLFNKTQKITRLKGDKIGLEFHIFDILPLEEFKKGISSLTYTERRKTLNILDGYLIALSEINKFIKIVPVLYNGHDIKAIEHYLAIAIKAKQEGLMININNSYYETRRSYNIMKVKEFYTVDLLCVGIYEGTGNLEGTLGGINVEYKGNIVNVGSGFKRVRKENDLDLTPLRSEIWENPELIINKIIEVQYFEETENSKNDKLSLRFPVFIRIRDDKNEISYS